MKKTYSLKSNIEFNAIIQYGKKLKQKHIFVAYNKANNFKIGISIPKKIGNAVFRNRQKRIIKNIIPNTKAYEVNMHVVFVIRNSFANLSFIEKGIILNKIFKELNEQ